MDDSLFGLHSITRNNIRRRIKFRLRKIDKSIETYNIIYFAEASVLNVTLLYYYTRLCGFPRVFQIKWYRARPLGTQIILGDPRPI